MDQTNFNFIESKKAYETRFFQFPQVLLYGEKYKKLSDSAKLGYMILRDRLDYSLRNNWIDEKNRVYFIFTNQELHNLFGWGNAKIVKVKKELERAKLLYQVNLGFDPKKKKNLPNHLYLADLEVTTKDIYKKKITNEEPKSLDTSGSFKMKHNLNNTRGLDTNRYNIDTQKLDFSTANFSSAEIQKQNQDLVNHANDFLTDEDSGLPVFLEPEAVQLLSFWCRTPQQMRRFIGIILNAKYRVEKDHQDIGVIIPLGDEELKSLMTKALRRYFNALRSNEKHIKNVENYLYGTMQNLFGVWWNKQAAREYAAKHPEEQNTDNERS
ncbi:replication initiator protein A [Lentilactobacillus parabuchneri]|uniref:replication initiator protein A n=1 Tax=Lentilactobacillus parabuchneri TaxID=152331 RepID=UPI0024467386|nr:replication initiator protein A [Lentilactobacillus parabuchneri]MDG9738245.1 replication initiator protein A [Lentilactobacillus parabuchneri]